MTNIQGKVKMTYIHNYDMAIAKIMTAGVDVWLNTPRRPQEPLRAPDDDDPPRSGKGGGGVRGYTDAQANEAPGTFGRLQGSSRAPGDDDSPSGSGKGGGGVRGHTNTHQFEALETGSRGRELAPNEQTDQPSVAGDGYSQRQIGLSTCEASPSTLAQSRDPAFEHLVDMQFLQTATNSGNASQLADVALQFAEAERVLLRSHHDVTAEQLIKLAAKLAVGKDKTTMDRLVKAAKLQKNEKLVAELEAMAKLNGESRAINPAEMVSVLDTTPEAFAAYHNLLMQLDTAKRLGDREVLKMLEKMLQLTHGLSKQQIEYIKTSIASAEKATPERLGSSLEALRKLGGNSRGFDPRNPFKNSAVDPNTWRLPRPAPPAGSGWSDSHSNYQATIRLINDSGWNVGWSASGNGGGQVPNGNQYPQLQLSNTDAQPWIQISQPNGSSGPRWNVYNGQTCHFGYDPNRPDPIYLWHE